METDQTLKTKCPTLPKLTNQMLESSSQILDCLLMELPTQLLREHGHVTASECGSNVPALLAIVLTQSLVCSQLTKNSTLASQCVRNTLDLVSFNELN